MGDRSQPFVSKVADYSETHPEFMPGYVDKAAFQRAIRRIDALRPCQRRFDQYKSMADDSIGIAGSDALTTGALPYYKTTKEAAKNKQPAAVTLAEEAGSAAVEQATGGGACRQGCRQGLTAPRGREQRRPSCSCLTAVRARAPMSWTSAPFSLAW